MSVRVSPEPGARVGKRSGGAPGSVRPRREGQEALRGWSLIPFRHFFGVNEQRWNSRIALPHSARYLCSLGAKLRGAGVILGGAGAPGWEGGARPRPKGEGWRSESATPHLGCRLPALLP